MPRGAFEHGGGHADLIDGQIAQELRGRVQGAGHPLRKLDPDSLFHLLGELAQKVVEQRGMGRLGRRREEEVGDLVEERASLLARRLAGQGGQRVELAAGDVGGEPRTGVVAPLDDGRGGAERIAGHIGSRSKDRRTVHVLV